MKYRAILVLVVPVWLAVGAVAAEPREFFQPVDPPRAYQVMVHRGLASIAPENTRAAIDRAIEDGLEWVEIDVRLTKDGQHVVFHDGQLDGKTNGRGAVKDHTLAELQAVGRRQLVRQTVRGREIAVARRGFAARQGKDQPVSRLQGRRSREARRRDPGSAGMRAAGAGVRQATRSCAQVRQTFRRRGGGDAQVAPGRWIWRLARRAASRRPSRSTPTRPLPRSAGSSTSVASKCRPRCWANGTIPSSGTRCWPTASTTCKPTCRKKSSPT